MLGISKAFDSSYDLKFAFYFYNLYLASLNLKIYNIIKIRNFGVIFVCVCIREFFSVCESGMCVRLCVCE